MHGHSTAEQIAEQLKDKSTVEKLQYLADAYPGKVVFTTSFGYEDQVITDFIFKNNIAVQVVTLDTGRMFEETYKVLRSTVEKYGKEIKVFFPDAEKVEQMVSEKGPFSFYESIENRKECCFIRKVIPLKRALAGNSIWITGLRAEQSANRSNLEEVEWMMRIIF